MKNRKLLIIILCILIIPTVIVNILLISLVSNSGKLQSADYSIFSDIEELNILDEYVIEDNLEDKYLKNLTPAEEYTKLILWNEHKYEVYAYTFDSLEVSQQYFRQATGTKTQSNWRVDLITNVTKFYYTAYCQDCVIRICAANSWAFPDF